MILTGALLAKAAFGAPPVADFLVTPASGSAPLTVALDGRAASDADGGIVDYQWSSSDGQSASGQQASLTFSSAGDYTVTLTVTDDQGESTTSESAQISVQARPVASFTATPDSGAAPLTVTLDATASSDSDGRIVSYEWSSSDGQSTAGQTATMTFTGGGAQVVTLTVTDDSGNTSTAEQTINVSQDFYPVPRFTMSPGEGLAPLTVSLDASASSDEDGNIVDYRWVSSDGQITFGRNASLTFSSAGIYTVTLTVVDDQGLSATSDPVNAVTPVSASSHETFSTTGAITRHVFEVPGDGVLSDGSLRVGLAGYYYSSYAYTSIYVDGESYGRQSVSLRCSEPEYATIDIPMADLQRYAADGEVVVELRNSSSVYAFCNDNTHDVELSYNQGATGQVTVQGPPTAEFTATPNGGAVPLTVVLSAAASSDPDGSIVDYQWSLSDGRSGSGQSSRFTFDSVGEYLVTLTVTDDDGLTATSSSTITVTDQPQPPEPSFTATPSSGAAPLTVTLDASASSDPDGRIVEYRWLASDGQSATGQVAEMTFDRPGSYRVNLTVLDDQGLSASAVTGETTTFDQTSSEDFSTTANGGVTRHLFTVPSGEVQGDATLTVAVSGEFGASYEYAEIFVDGERVGTHGTRDCVSSGSATFTIPQADMAAYAADGLVEVEVRNSAYVNGNACSENLHEVELAFDSRITSGEIEVVAGPAAHFTVTPDSGTVPLSVALDASGSSAADGRIVDYQWSSSDGQRASGESADMIFDTAGEYTITLTVTDDAGYQGSAEQTVVVEAPVPLSYDTTARLRPQVIAAGVSPSQVDFDDTEFDIVAIVRPGALPIETVSLRHPGGTFEMAMLRSGVLANGDEVYRATLTFPRNAFGTQVMGTAWGAEADQFNVVVTDQGQQRSHAFPNLEVHNAPAMASNAAQAEEPVVYNVTKRLVPQVVMAGFSPSILDIADTQFDVLAVVRDGAVPIQQVTATQNESSFRMAMTEAGELSNGDRLYRLIFTYPRGAFPEGLVLSTVWGDQPGQYGIQAVDESQQTSHRFPDIQFGNYPALP
ncbi:PKD domain-containing protein [Endothiovibrio diazotrophicus]